MVAPQVEFRPYLELLGVYDTGLAGVGVVDPQGDLGNTASFGMEATGGISGVHSWKHTTVGLDYRLSLRHYTHTTYYDGLDQALMLGVTHRLTRHATLTLRESAGQYSRDYGLLGLSEAVPFDPSTSYIPSTDFFDNRTIYLSTQADLTYQKTARLSFDIGGDGFLVRRRSSALYGVTGAAARGDVQYRITRHTTIGADYSYTNFDFTGVFSGTDLHSMTAAYAVRLSRTVEFSAYGGAMRVETKFLQSVPLDPVIAALIGQTSGIVVSYHVNYVPDFSGRLSKTFHHGVAYLAGGHTVTPGNGLFLTSAISSVTAGYTYTGLRHWSFNTAAGYEKAKSISNVIGYYGGYSGALTVSRQISRSVHALLSVDARKYQSNDFTRYNRLIYGVRIGLGFSPGDIPLRVW